MKISRIHRLLRLVTLLQNGGNYTADELAEQLEVSRRTVFRDLNMLELAHVPYYYDTQAGSYRISRHFWLPPINLTLSEALALFALAGRLENADAVPLGTHATRAVIKLQNALPASLREHVTSMAQQLQVDLGPISRHNGLDATFQQLALAASDRIVCRITYDSFNDRCELNLEIHPLRLVFMRRGWYVLAFSVEHDEVRTFKLSRIRKITATDRHFPPHDDFDLDKQFGNAWSMIPGEQRYHVQLRFEPMVAQNVAEVQWHRTQQVQWNEDGSIIFSVDVDGLDEMLWWILGYGDQVEVLDPPELRERFASTARRMLEKHER
ncbi:MAG: helix-turn-helix transcriptional regulator [Planctomycetota bacterium]